MAAWRLKGFDLTICTWITLEIYNDNDQQFNRHDFLIKFNLII